MCGSGVWEWGNGGGAGARAWPCSPAASVPRACLQEEEGGAPQGQGPRRGKLHVTIRFFISRHRVCSSCYSPAHITLEAPSIAEEAWLQTLCTVNCIRAGNSTISMFFRHQATESYSPCSKQACQRGCWFESGNDVGGGAALQPIGVAHQQLAYAVKLCTCTTRHAQLP